MEERETEEVEEKGAQVSRTRANINTLSSLIPFLSLLHTLAIILQYLQKRVFPGTICSEEHFSLQMRAHY